MPLKKYNTFKICVEDDESPIMLGSREAGLQAASHWVTVTTTKDVREYNKTLDQLNWTQDQLRKDYRELSLELINIANRFPEITEKEFDRLHFVFTCWSLTRKRLFGKELPFSKSTEIVSHYKI